MPRRNNDHLDGEHEDLFIFLSDEGLRPRLHPGHVRRLVEDVDVVVGRDPEQGHVARRVGMLTAVTVSAHGV